MNRLQKKSEQKKIQGHEELPAFLDDDRALLDIPPIIGKANREPALSEQEAKNNTYDKRKDKKSLEPAFLGDDYDDTELPHRYTIRD